MRLSPSGVDVVASLIFIFTPSTVVSTLPSWGFFCSAISRCPIAFNLVKSIAPVLFFRLRISTISPLIRKRTTVLSFLGSIWTSLAPSDTAFLISLSAIYIIGERSSSDKFSYALALSFRVSKSSSVINSRDASWFPSEVVTLKNGAIFLGSEIRRS